MGAGYYLTDLWGGLHTLTVFQFFKDVREDQSVASAPSGPVCAVVVVGD